MAIALTWQHGLSRSLRVAALAKQIARQPRVAG